MFRFILLYTENAAEILFNVIKKNKNIFRDVETTASPSPLQNTLLIVVLCVSPVIPWVICEIILVYTKYSSKCRYTANIQEEDLVDF